MNIDERALSKAVRHAQISCGAPLIAVMSVDPGGTTGVSIGLFCAEKRTTRERIENGWLLLTEEVEGSWERQAMVLAALYDHVLLQLALAGLEIDELHLVIEDFILRPKAATAARDMLMPVRVGCALQGRLEDVSVVWQSPALAKSYATNDRLKEWGWWVKGSTHSRDALRHIAAYLHGRKW